MMQITCRGRILRKEAALHINGQMTHSEARKSFVQDAEHPAAVPARVSMALRPYPKTSFPMFGTPVFAGFKNRFRRFSDRLYSPPQMN